MKHLVLATAAVLALGTGTAFADGTTPSQPAQATQPAQITQHDARVLDRASHSSVWIYPAFRNGYAQGGDR